MTLPGFAARASLRSQNTFRHGLFQNFMTSVNSVTPLKLTPNPETEECGRCNKVNNERECKRWVEGSGIGDGYWYIWYEDCCPRGYTWVQKGPGSYNGKCCKRNGKFETCLSS